MTILVMKKSDEIRIVLIIAAILLSVTGCVNDPPEKREKPARISVLTEGNGAVDGIPSDTTVTTGVKITLKATPESGYIFAGWRAGRLYTENPLSISVTGDLTITACFAPKPEKMILIRSSDSVFTMGSDAGGTPEEKPAHLVRFAHDFYIGATEVTQGEYSTLMSGVPGYSGTAQDIGDSFPVYSVTWYDAVLYCNELSKKQGYDTVYTYTSVCSTETCPFILENLQTHFDRFGYRLPTEAEWEYACRAGSKTEYFWNSIDDPGDYAWYDVNSGSQVHKTGQKLPNRYGIFDMCGNVAEWVNDWLDNYPDSMVTDPVGPTHLHQEQFESSWERPIRGGSCRLAKSYLRSSARRGPYETGAFMSQVDIGFRVAMGSFQAQSKGPLTVEADSVQFSFLAGKTDLINFTGTSKVKIAFVHVNKRLRNLYLLDYAGSGIQVRKIGKDESVHCPMISPDGKYVAYSSRTEGSTGICTLTVRSLDDSGKVLSRFNGFIPRWWVSQTSMDTFLIYSNGASMNNLPRWYTEKTYRIRVQGGVTVGSPEILWDTGSYHGGLSSDGRFLATAYPTARLVDLQINDTTLFYFKPPMSGRTDTAQVCNLSISPSRLSVDEVMFLDFGYPGVSTQVGKPYGFHSVIFICNSRVFNMDHVKRFYEVPSPYDQWDYTEWSNHPDYAVSLARSYDYQNAAIHIIRLKDSTYLKAAENSSIHDVSMWIDPSEIIEKDDPYRFFGKYDIPIQTWGQGYAAKKLRLFWHFRNNLQCVILGCSPAFFGIDSRMFSQKTLNLSFATADPTATAFLAEKYILPHTPKLKVLVFELIAYWYNKDTYTVRPILCGLKESKGFELDESQSFYKNGIPAEIEQKISMFDQDQWLDLDTSGFIYLGEGSGWGEPILEREDFDFNDSIVQLNLQRVRDIVETATQIGVKVLIVNFPQNPAYKGTGMLGRLGPSDSTYARIVSVMDSIENKNSSFKFYDAGNGGNHDYTDAEAFDCNHLNSLGGLKMASRLDSIMLEMLK